MAYVPSGHEGMEAVYHCMGHPTQAPVDIPPLVAWCLVEAKGDQRNPVEKW